MLRSALVLLKYLENVQEFPYPAFWKGKSILDVGSGTGVVGIACALLATGISGTHVTLTDRAPLLDLLNYNAFKLNQIPQHRLAVKELEWGNPLPKATGTPETFDLILLSDVVTKAYKESYPGLIKSLQDLANENTRIILGYELRDTSDRQFFDLLTSSGFSLTKVTEDKLDPEYSAEDIGIFEIRKLAPSSSSSAPTNEETEK
jgi:predicted nicotinamide N-methyase